LVTTIFANYLQAKSLITQPSSGKIEWQNLAAENLKNSPGIVSLPAKVSKVGNQSVIWIISLFTLLNIFKMYVYAYQGILTEGKGTVQLTSLNENV